MADDDKFLDELTAIGSAIGHTMAEQNRELERVYEYMATPDGVACFRKIVGNHIRSSMDEMGLRMLEGDQWAVEHGEVRLSLGMMVKLLHTLYQINDGKLPDRDQIEYGWDVLFSTFLADVGRSMDVWE